MFKALPSLARLASLAAVLGVLSSGPAFGQPIVKIINFTADWCPNCAVLNPKLDAALADFAEGEILQVDLDLTASQSTDEAERQQAFRDATALAQFHQAEYLWDWYGGLTGLAVFIAADNGEPISCATRQLSVEDIESRLNEAKVLALRAPQGSRKPAGPDCPTPEELSATR